MKASRSGTAVVLMLIVAVVAVLATQTTALAPKRAAVVAVINTAELFDSLQEKMQIEAEQHERARALEEQRVARAKVIENLRADLENIFVPNTPTYDEKETEMITKAAEYESWYNLQRQLLQRETNVKMQALDRKLRDAIKRTAELNNVDLVLNRQTAVPVVAGNQQRNFPVHIALYASPDLDLTQEVAQLMNNELKAAAPKP